MTRNRMDRFGIFIGTWNKTGDVYAIKGSPAITLAASGTYCWPPGRRFIVHKADARFGKEAARSREIIGQEQEMPVVRLTMIAAGERNSK